VRPQVMPEQGYLRRGGGRGAADGGGIEQGRRRRAHLVASRVRIRVRVGVGVGVGDRVRVVGRTSSKWQASRAVGARLRADMPPPSAVLQEGSTW